VNRSRAASNGDKSNFGQFCDTRFHESKNLIVEPLETLPLKYIPAKKICICIDDFGLHQGINSAALHLISVQRVHAVSCMTKGVAWKQGAKSLRNLDKVSLDIGLHLDFTEHALINRQAFSLNGLIARSYLRHLTAEQVRSEITIQLDAFEQEMGRAPAFVDGHQHVHQLPIIRAELLLQVSQRYPSNLPWIRSTRSAEKYKFKARLIQLLGQSRLKSDIQRRGLLSNERFLGVYDFSGSSERYLKLVESWLSIACTGDLFMCHPSAQGDEKNIIGAARQREYQVLSSDAFDKSLKVNTIQLMPMSKILR
jgi:chitin disaccharide deacetylase